MARSYKYFKWEDQYSTWMFRYGNARRAEAKLRRQLRKKKLREEQKLHDKLE